MKNVNLLLLIGILALAGCHNSNEPGAAKPSVPPAALDGCKPYEGRQTQYDETLKAGQYVFVKMIGAADVSFEDDTHQWDVRNPHLTKLAGGNPVVGGYEGWTFAKDGWASYRIKEDGTYRFTYGPYSGNFGKGKALICPQDTADFKEVPLVP